MSSIVFFFFKQKTAYEMRISDWSSDVCSSDLGNAYALLVFTMLCWGGNAVAGRIAVGEISPMLLTTGRWAGVAVLIAVFARRRVVAEWPVIDRKSVV